MASLGRMTASTSGELIKSTHSSRRFNRRPVIPAAQSDPNGCSFLETRAHARSLT